ncbi:MAG: hypothetical protein NUV92_09730 [Ignavibacteria bacterium]|jgi:hypothetical protein|nr:hypothetical protein [Ignavibacteria bacterium]MDH7528206.1 hypothetical protein [Ignavibacteria bacterium]NPV10415.1 hypothetical protein [Ignavibacteria bacterium]
MEYSIKISHKIGVKLVALALLGTIAFTFLHSELGFFDFDGDNHGAHDFCEIVKNISSRTKTIKDELPKLGLTKILCTRCLQIEETSVQSFIYNKTYQPTILSHSTHTYLFNSTFLI